MLKPDRERADIVVTAVEKDAKTNSASKYTFDKFCKEHTLYNDKIKHLGSGDVFISCPFHLDRTPSLSFNESKRIWNCLGCGKGGKYLDFVFEYKKVVEGHSGTWYQHLNELLADDLQLQQQVGFSSIYKKEREKEEFKPLSYRKFSQQRVYPKTFLELATILQRKSCDYATVQYALLLMQSGFSAEDIYKFVFVKDDLDSIKKDRGCDEYNLDKILEGVDNEG